MSTPRERRAPSVEQCVVAECGEVAVRHLSLTEARRAFPSLSDKGHRAPLCRTHYKEWKKATRESRKLDRLAFDRPAILQGRGGSPGR